MAFVCTFRVCHARDLAWELVNGDDGGGLHGKVASNSEESWPTFLMYTSMITYITSYKAINTKLIGLGCPAHPREDQTWNCTHIICPHTHRLLKVFLNLCEIVSISRIVKNRHVFNALILRRLNPPRRLNAQLS